ncbi:MAG: glutathione S-transferase [Beijerinckiaceae bacterium]|jgi:glutathione S-transferase|nr:glutathione S-transferase [Beijerinckiaceae bacterium]
MRLFDGGRVPNARRVRIYLAEKGITVPMVPVDLGKMDHRSLEFTARNPLQRVPVLELDDGSHLSESIAICRYFEELHPDPPLFGTGARERAFVEMWQRRVELELYLAVQAAFRHTHPAMAEYEVPQVSAWGEANRPRALNMLALLDRELADKPFLVGSSFTVADITLMVTLDFLKPAKIALPEQLEHLRRWHGAVSSRPSATA